MSRFFLGLDCSTQSLTSVLVDLEQGSVAHSATFAFDQLPHYGAARGVLPNADPSIVHAPPLMWAEALDLLLGRMKGEGVPLEEVAAVSGSGQQHGSVYMKPDFSERLARLDPRLPLAEQLKDAFSRDSSPIWMDSSTTTECNEIAAAMGSSQKVAHLTGSVPFERFTGPQIRAFWKCDPENYEATAHIHLVSSFMASLLGGVNAPIDPGDGAGMNLMDLRQAIWAGEALNATAPGLAERLPRLAPSWTVTGTVSPYWSRRHSLNPEALNVVWSGDNPCSLVGLGVLHPGTWAVSLGTSDTCSSPMAEPFVDPRGEGHVFGHPAGGWMSLLCFRNGGLARERIRDAFNLGWEGFSRALEATPFGNQGGLMLPWFEPEIVPKVLHGGVHSRGLDPNNAAAQVRGVMEGQMLAQRLHSAWMGRCPERILVTGGASRNSSILQVIADVHQAEVQRLMSSDGAALGAALRAAHAWHLQRGVVDWESITAAFIRPDPLVFRPSPGTASIAENHLLTYQAFEREALETGNLPNAQSGVSEPSRVAPR